jgi:hypothetical protein
VLALPVAEFLAVKHDTAYLGYSQHSSSSSKHPFFASGPPSTGRRRADADAADAEASTAAAAAAAPAAMDTDSNAGDTPAAAPAAAADGGGGGGAGSVAGGSPGKSPRKGGGLGRAGSAPQAKHHKGHRRPSSEVGLRLITCKPESTLGEVRFEYLNA